MNYCSGVTGAGVRAVAEHCSQLQELNVSCCDNVTGAAVRAMEEQCKFLLLVVPQQLELFHTCGWMDFGLTS